MLDRAKVVKTLLVFLAITVAGGMVLFFVLGERAVVNQLSQNGPLTLMGQPAWASEKLIESLYEAAEAREFPLRTESLRVVAARLEESCWLKNVRVQLTGDALVARADWHRPVALVKRGTTRFYVDANCVALEFVSLTNLPLVTLTGVSVVRRPALGRVVELEDLKAAVALVSLLMWMDERVVPTKPLLREIESIDMSNFRGVRKGDSPHIVLYAQDKTPIEWGAEIDSWAQYMEASDEEKLASLYTYYQERGTLQGGVKSIKLWAPRAMPRPAQQVRGPNY